MHGEIIPNLIIFVVEEIMGTRKKEETVKRPEKNIVFNAKFALSHHKISIMKTKGL